MEDLEIIHRVLDQHLVLLDQFNIVGFAMSDKESLIRLEKAQADLAAHFKRPLNERCSYVLESLKLIALGMEKHYAFEEEILAPLLGEVFNKALIFEHIALKREMQSCIASLESVKIEGLGQTEEIELEAGMSRSIKTVWARKTDHQKREEAIISTLERVIHYKAENHIIYRINQGLGI